MQAGLIKACQSWRHNLLSLWKLRDLRLRKMFFRKVWGVGEVLSTQEAQLTVKNSRQLRTFFEKHQSNRVTRLV